MLGGQIEQDDHALACHHVAEPVRIDIAGLFQVAIDRVGDIDRERGNPELVDDELRVRETLGTRGAVRHAHADHVLPAQRLRGEKCGERGIHAARQSDETLLEAAPADDFVLEKTD